MCVRVPGPAALDETVAGGRPGHRRYESMITIFFYLPESHRYDY
jgi:hypothetical protein